MNPNPPVTPTQTHPPRRLSVSSSLGTAPLQEQATDWVKHNQYAAMVSAFALGVFLGILARR